MKAKEALRELLDDHDRLEMEVAQLQQERFDATCMLVCIVRNAGGTLRVEGDAIRAGVKGTILHRTDDKVSGATTFRLEYL